MKNFHHPNVLRLLGVVFDTPDGLPYLVLPFMKNGNLKDYLKSQRVEASDIDTLPQVSYVSLRRKDPRWRGGGGGLRGSGDMLPGHGLLLVHFQVKSYQTLPMYNVRSFRSVPDLCLLKFGALDHLDGKAQIHVPISHAISTCRHTAECAG